MASLLRQIVAGPRARHPEAGIDLCYVTDNIIATSGPGSSYPQLAYRTPIKDLVQWLDSQHGENWAIWEFRAEGTGYPDSEVYNRVRHYPWPDHHPPPFALVPLIVGSMRNWLKDKEAPDRRVVVVHCKAGKGRSGTMACSYLISEEGWAAEDAMKRFTERRMRSGFGVGISIPSQQRWVRYVERWSRYGKLYVERPVEILELHIWGLKEGVKIVVEGYVDEGKVIKKFHTFTSKERVVMGRSGRTDADLADVAIEARKRSAKKETDESDDKDTATDQAEESALSETDVIFKPSSRVVLPSSDINIDIERRNKTKYGGFTMVTTVAHVWFNTFFEGHGPENSGTADDSGVFTIDFDAMDGLKGSSRKGRRAFEKMAVVWKAVDTIQKSSVTVREPSEGEEVKQMQPSNWRGQNKEGSDTLPKKLGLRVDQAESGSVSRASSSASMQSSEDANGSADELVGVRSDVPGRDAASSSDTQKETVARDPPPQLQLDGVAHLEHDMKHLSTSGLPQGTQESQMHDRHEHSLGHMEMTKNTESSS